MGASLKYGPPYDSIRDSMGESEGRWFAGKRGKVFVLVVVVAALVVAASAAVVAVRQIQDYHDAKYRAQFVIVSFLPPMINEASYQVELIINENVSVEGKFTAADEGWTDFRFLFWSAEELRVMYLDDDEKVAHLQDLRDAFAAFQGAMSQTKAQLMGPDYSWPGVLAPSFVSSLNTTVPILKDIMDMIGNAVGDKESAMEHPYSLVDRLDLSALSQASRTIVDTLGT